MRKLAIKICLFLVLAVAIPSTILFFLPPSPRWRASLFFAQIDKDSLLKNTPGPRIIFIGGSNLSFGLNSQMIKDSLGLNPINTGIHAGLGLVYMLDHSRDFIQEGDIVIVAPEYDQYYGAFPLGTAALIHMKNEVQTSPGISHLRGLQMLNMIKFVPEYLHDKAQFTEYWNYSYDRFYSRKSFNQYGDAVGHWNDSAQHVEPYSSPDENLSSTAFKALKEFQQVVIKKKASMFISFPGIQFATFANYAEDIDLAVKTLKETKQYKFLGTPEEFRFPDSLLFNSPYHLNKKGVDMRTERVIQNLKRVL